MIFQTEMLELCEVQAASKRHSEQGILFMQELVQRVKMQQQGWCHCIFYVFSSYEVHDMYEEGTQMPVYVEILFPAEYKRSFMAGPAIFGPSLLDDSSLSFRSVHCFTKICILCLRVACVIGNIKVADPPEACGSLENGQTLRGHVALIRRGSCTFIEKVCVYVLVCVCVCVRLCDALTHAHSCHASSHWYTRTGYFCDHDISANSAKK